MQSNECEGEPGTDDHDTGRVLDIDGDAGKALVGWDAGAGRGRAMTAKKRVPKPSAAREHIVPVRFGAAELATLHARAEAAGLEPSTYLRALALRPETDPAAVAAVAHRAARAALRVTEQAEQLGAAVDELDAARRAIEIALPE